ncbi:hypothetical protein ANANG_G00004680 [Anguilla anguilla]|uniref:Uncharacterized protein n=1 Tax=Anguilla anguilla TaxID=7936 RepID=A0A9D3S619_ANGAN|nr:hypothetical protein ANANG_G00004680 [Anguilla anguilla]
MGGLAIRRREHRGGGTAKTPRPPRSSYRRSPLTAGAARAMAVSGPGDRSLITGANETPLYSERRVGADNAALPIATSQ